MAKFRSGNLVLQSDQTIIQNSITVLDDTRSGRFVSLKLDSALANIINEFSIDGTLAGNSNIALPTEKAVKTYVDNKISGSISSSTDNILARYDGTDGIQGSGITIDDSDNIIDVGEYRCAGDAKLTNSQLNDYILMSSTSRDFSYYSDGSLAFYIDSTGNGIFSGNLEIQGSSKAAGVLYTGTTDPTNTDRLNYDGYFYGTKVFNAIWNDIADFQKVIDEKIPGKCYYDTLKGAKICDKRCQKSVIGILSDTYGIGVGSSSEQNYAPFAIAGWVLAFVEYACEPGDVLTNSENGNLIKMKDEEKSIHPERIVAIYKGPELQDYWGANQNKILVNGRHWVKVK